MNSDLNNYDKKLSSMREVIKNMKKQLQKSTNESLEKSNEYTKLFYRMINDVNLYL
jgi:hypothetical protein